MVQRQRHDHGQTQMRREVTVGQSFHGPAAAGVLRRAEAVRTGEVLHSSRYLFAFIIFEFACQLATLLPSLHALRTAVRVGAFSGSLVLVLVLRGAREKHPVWPIAGVIIAILSANLAHPETNGPVAGVATVLLALAILGPIFWVPRIRVDADTIRGLFLLLWIFNTASAIVGALQVYFPGQFQPAHAAILSDEAFEGLHITLASGARVPRPMGLTDVPGGACVGAAYTVLLASAFLLARPRAAFRAILIASIVMACFTLYLTQVRALVVMLAISLVGILAMSSFQRRLGRTTLIALVVLGAASVGLGLALSIGGEAVTTRLSSLIASDPKSIYYSNRGFFLEQTYVDLLPQYPIGAGLGRWGMVCAYFGDNSSRPIWAEIQWTSWLLDGGVPLTVAYTLAMVIALAVAVRIARRGSLENRDLLAWAGTLVGYSVGTIALTFSTAPFAGTAGLDFWLLNATLFAASRQKAAATAGGDGRLARGYPADVGSLPSRAIGQRHA
jgi:hypothetical protein